MSLAPIPRATLLLLAACGACASSSALPRGGTSVTPADMPCAGGRSAVRDVLHFGHNIPGGATVADSAWQAFVATEITPRFPGGFTLQDATGNWQGANGRPEFERTTMFELIHPASRSTDSLLRVVALAYKSRFAQEAVLHEQSVVCSELL